VLALALVLVGCGGGGGHPSPVHYEQFSWDELSPPHATPPPSLPFGAVGTPVPTPAPRVIRALSGRHIDARGFVVGLEVTHAGLRRFLLIRHRAPCCFGRGPLPSAWIDVFLPEGKEIEFDPYRPVEVRGTLRAQEAPSGDVFLAMDAVEARILERID